MIKIGAMVFFSFFYLIVFGHYISAIIKLNEIYIQIKRGRFMKGKFRQQAADKYSMGISVFIALCVIGLFCAVSIAIIENFHHSEQGKGKHITLPNSKDLTDFVL